MKTHPRDTHKKSSPARIVLRLLLLAGIVAAVAVFATRPKEISNLAKIAEPSDDLSDTVSRSPRHGIGENLVSQLKAETNITVKWISATEVGSSARTEEPPLTSQEASDRVTAWALTNVPQNPAAGAPLAMAFTVDWSRLTEKRGVRFADYAASTRDQGNVRVEGLVTADLTLISSHPSSSRRFSDGGAYIVQMSSGSLGAVGADSLGLLILCMADSELVRGPYNSVDPGYRLASDQADFALDLDRIPLGMTYRDDLLVASTILLPGSVKSWKQFLWIFRDFAGWRLLTPVAWNGQAIPCEMTYRNLSFSFPRTDREVLVAVARSYSDRSADPTRLQDGANRSSPEMLAVFRIKPEYWSTPYWILATEAAIGPRVLLALSTRGGHQ